MYRILVIFSVIASLLFAAPLKASELPKGDFAELRQTGQGKVIQIISPLSVQLENGKILRLSGINIPDYSGEDAGPSALLAVQILKDMLEGHEVILYQTRKNDVGRINRMGHEIVHIVRKSDDAWVQGTLIKLGLAIVQTTKTNPEMAAQMLALEESARKEKLGLWENTLRILTPEEAGAHTGSFQIVEGRVESAALKKNRLYMNFGKNWRDDFTVTVAPENKRAFSKDGINMLDWNGQNLRVRGWITDYNGPNMEIDHPGAIQKISPQKSVPPAADPQNGKAENVLPPAMPVKPVLEERLPASP